MTHSAITATLAQPVEADDIRRPREVRLLLEQLAAVGLTLVPLSAQRHLPDGCGATNSQLRQATGIAGSYHVALAELRGQKQCPGGRWPKCEGQLD
jgi:hypothetical protein